METMVLEAISTASSYCGEFIVMKNGLNLILKFDHGTIAAHALALCAFNWAGLAV